MSVEIGWEFTAVEKILNEPRRGLGTELGRHSVWVRSSHAAAASGHNSYGLAVQVPTSEIMRPSGNIANQQRGRRRDDEGSGPR
jgi:hypothetical protein